MRALPTKRRPRVLITGAAGLIGTILMRRLAGRYELTGVDSRRATGVRVADLTALDAARAACAGVDTVVDLAAATGEGVDWVTVCENNIRATLTVLAAAQEADVKRVVFASSNHVTGLYEREHPYSAIVAGKYEGLDPARVPAIAADTPIRPDSAYAVGKAAGEAAGRYYAETSSLSVICLRIGSVNRAGRPRNARHFATLLTHGDLVRLVECAIAAPPASTFEIVYGVSANTWRFWDIERARETIGYAPRDNAERWR